MDLEDPNQIDIHMNIYIYFYLSIYLYKYLLTAGVSETELFLFFAGTPVIKQEEDDGDEESWKFNLQCFYRLSYSNNI